jgi:hypothetical protein
MRKTARRSASRSAPPRRSATDATNRSIGLDERLYEYLCETTLREPELMAQLRAETSRLPRGTMQISPEQGQLMGLLARAAARYCPRSRGRYRVAFHPA